ncbi:hypothetical protein FGLOB1_12836 [Fusarium globosum]|uniref:Uncharacterized protein n=1 Tax=Fusarium globosum TaxID=78864 RepID=A0A8H5XPN7_9HYPO|nr:hypothetical protein FGLOB1_12836 [Fusarium globosum]
MPASSSNDKATSKVDGYNMSQHPWYRKFREALIKGDFEPGYLLGVIQMYNGEGNIPNSLKTMINEWTRAGLTDPGLDQRKKDAKSSDDPQDLVKFREEMKEMQMENNRRIAELNAVRKTAALLGFPSAGNEALDEKSITMRLEFVAPKNKKKGHAPGCQTVETYAKTTTALGKKRELTADEVAKKRARIRYVSLGSSSKTVEKSGKDDSVASNENAIGESGEADDTSSKNETGEESGDGDGSVSAGDDAPKEAPEAVPEKTTQGGSTGSAI